MTTLPVSSHGSFYEDEERWAKEWAGKMAAGLVAMAALLLVLLLWLKSAPLVWAYIVVLFCLALWGFAHLDHARKSILEAIAHLRGVDERLHGEMSRDDLLAHLGREESPADLSNVPEALLSLAKGSVNGDSIRIAATSAFALPATELNFASFLRAAMVLGGLFGTVLFFAFELAGMKTLSTDPTQVISGLSGALVSTLTGIVGSLALGLAASFMDRHVENLIRETEAFLNGPFSAALAAVPVRKTVQSEAELWENLRAEVAQLTARSTEAFGKMGSDIHTHARALEALGEQLRTLPAVVVPPELANLGTVVGEFVRGTELLEKTATLLVNTVATLGVFAPAKMLHEIETMNGAVSEHHRRIDEAVAEQNRTIATGLGQVSTSLADAGARVASAGRTLETTAEATQARVTAVAEEVVQKLGRTVDLSSVYETADQTRQTVAGLREDLGDTRRVLEAQQTQVGTILARVEQTAGALDAATRAIASVADTISDAAVSAQAQAPLVAIVRDALERQAHELGALTRRLGRLDDVFRWHERAQRAPIMRMLTMPWRRAAGATSDPPPS